MSVGVVSCAGDCLNERVMYGREKESNELLTKRELYVFGMCWHSTPNGGLRDGGMRDGAILPVPQTVVPQTVL